MSLQIWLPLTKDLRNQGVCDTTITSSNLTTADATGKLGMSYYFNSSYILGTQNFISNNTDEWTFSCWMKLHALTTGQTLFSCRTGAAATGITVFYYGSTWIIDDGARWTFTPTNTIAAEKWYHICVVRKKSVGKYLYVNGELDKSTTTTGTPTAVNTTTYAIGVCHNSATTLSGNPLNGFLNDVRFYDHALSEAEIKEVAKGLALHYKLDEFYSTDNLIINGMGELGTENWTTSSRSTTEIPSDHPEIKASFYSGNMTKHYIPIIKNHSYTISGYIKAMANQSGSKYPSIYPYDIDKKFIENHMCADGFNNTYKTTLAQPLHKGDTIVYATDLSAWTTSTSNYYYFCAVFGYKNSYGDVYPDMVYTHDTPKFGTYSDKSHIDKTNNTITLDSPFTGEDRPAGTTICQATQGSTYWYPWGGIAVSSIADWTAKTRTFVPATTNRLKVAAYIRWSTYGGVYIAGNKLVDNTFNDTQITDSSGYGNHGTKAGSISVSENTPRYSMSTVFDGSTSTITTESPVFRNTLNGPFTVSMWVYNSDAGDRSILFGNYRFTGGFFNIEKTTAEKVRFYWNGSPDITFANSILTANTFVLLTVTRNGNTVKSYINGVLKDTSTTTLNGSIPTTAEKFGIGTDSRTGSTRFKGQISDFRLYATCLTDDDVLALYNVGAKVSNKNEMLSYEMKEG